MSRKKCKKEQLKYMTEKKEPKEKKRVAQAKTCLAFMMGHQ